MGLDQVDRRAPAPWGCPPTPLLPQWYRTWLADRRLPGPLRRCAQVVTTVGQLDRFWEQTSQPLDRATLRSLIDLVADCKPPPDHVVIPAGVDATVLDDYPLRTRTRNALFERSQLLSAPTAAVTVGQLLAISHFGITSLLDLMCLIEAAPPPRSHAADPQPLDLDGHADVGGALWAGHGEADAWRQVVDALTVIVRAARDVYGATTLGDALALDLDRLATAFDLDAELAAIDIDALIDTTTIGERIIARLDNEITAMSGTQQLILERREFAAQPQTLEELGATVGVTRERIRQLQLRAADAIESAVGAPVAALAALTGERLGPVTDQHALDAEVAQLIPDDGQTARYARALLRRRLDYSCVEGICLNTEAVAIVHAIDRNAAEFGDDVGLVDEATLRHTALPKGWDRHWPQLRDRSGLHRIHGRLALRDTAKARIKAALLEIGDLATKEHIADVCGLPADRISAQLSAIPSVARASKHRWGLTEWVDDVYDGIAGEIIQRIHDDGGATTLRRLVDELPAQFGVSASSVRAYVATPQFVMRDGYVSLADASSVTYRPLDDVIDGRDATGAAYWTFVVEARYFDGYSLVGFPRELARELGCAPNDSVRIPLETPAGCAPLSISWRLSSPTGPSLGYLAEPLRGLGARAGDRICLVLIGPDMVALRRDDRPSQAASATSPDALLERMKNRRSVL